MVKKIYINPGHSDIDPGAVGYETERELNVKVSEYQRDYLKEKYICDVRMSSGTMTSLSSVINAANDWGADLFVSNHNNAGGGDGYEALVYDEKRINLGEVFEKHVTAVGQNSRGVKVRPNLAVLRDTNMPAVLNEGAFVDNKEDVQDWNDDRELKKLGEAYAKATAEYLSLPKKKNKNVNKTTASVEAVKPEQSYTVRVDIDRLNIRKGPGTDHDKTGTYTGRGIFTIVQTKAGQGSKTGWGRLRSGAGWICLDYTKKV